MLPWRLPRQAFRVIGIGSQGVGLKNRRPFSFRIRCLRVAPRIGRSWPGFSSHRPHLRSSREAGEMASAGNRCTDDRPPPLSGARDCVMLDMSPRQTISSRLRRPRSRRPARCRPRRRRRRSGSPSGAPACRRPRPGCCALVAKREKFADAEDLAAALGKKPTGGHWNSGIAVLRNNGLIEVEAVGAQAGVRRYRAAALLRE